MCGNYLVDATVFDLPFSGHVHVYERLPFAKQFRLQNVHDVFGKWEWHERLQSIARQFGLSADLVRVAA